MVGEGSCCMLGGNTIAGWDDVRSETSDVAAFEAVAVMFDVRPGAVLNSIYREKDSWIKKN